MEKRSNSNAERQQHTVKRQKLNDSCDGLSLNITSDNLRDPILYMVGYLEHSELLTLCSVCKHLLGAVEKFSRQTVTQVMEAHQTDDSFQVRLKSRFVPQKQGNIKTVPYRCLLKAAYEIYLYKLEMFPGTSDIAGGTALSKDGSRLVVAGTIPSYLRQPVGNTQWPPLYLYFWNLGEKTLIRTDEIATLTEEQAFSNVFWMGSNCVVCTDLRLLVVQADTGELTHAYTHDTYLRSVVQRNDDNLILLDQENNLFSFDVSTGNAELMFHLQGYSSEYPSLSLIAVCQSRWLVLNNCNDGPREGLRVHDLQNGCSETSHFGSSFSGVEASHDCPALFFTFDDETLQALTLNEASGHLTSSWTLLAPQPESDDAGIRYRGTRGSCVFYDHFFFPDKKPFLIVQSTQTAESQRYLQLPDGHYCSCIPSMVQSNGKELFVGIKSMPGHTGPGEKHGVVIAAYIADDKLLNNRFNALAGVTKCKPKTK